MCLLNKDQVNLIVTDVEMAKITFLHLADDLIDHICCEVENELKKGKSFEEAYELVKQQAGIKTLQKIQENTRYLIDKNYKIMKKTMRISGLVSLSLLGLATVFKIMHWPGASIGLVLGFAILCFVFLPSALYANYNEEKKKGQLLLHLSILIGGIAFMLGVLFKVQHWPGANLILMFGWGFLLWIFLPILLFTKLKTASNSKEKKIYTIGVIALFISELASAFKMFHWPGAMALMIIGSVMLFSVFLPMYTHYKFKETGKITGQFIFLIITAMFFVLFSYLLAFNTANNFSKNFANNGKNSDIITNYLEEKNTQLFTVYKNQPDSLKLISEAKVSEIINNADQLCKYIHSLKLQLVCIGENVDETTAETILNNPDLLKSKDSFDPIVKTMVNENKATELKNKLEQFKQLIISTIPENSTLTSFVNKSIDLSDKSFDKVKYTWEILNFGNTMIGALPILSDLEMKVRLMESKAIHSASINK